LVTGEITFSDTPHTLGLDGAEEAGDRGMDYVFSLQLIAIL
jgi:hypothetical protein